MEQAQDTPPADNERTILWVAYGLHALVFFSAGLATIAGVIINHIKYAESDNHIVASHHRWLLRTFWFGLLWCIVCIPLLFVMIGFAGLGIIAIWYVYRLVRGFLALVDNQPMPMPADLSHDG